MTYNMADTRTAEKFSKSLFFVRCTFLEKFHTCRAQQIGYTWLGKAHEATDHQTRLDHVLLPVPCLCHTCMRPKHLTYTVRYHQARFYVRAGGNCPPPTWALPPNVFVTTAVCSTKTCIYRGRFGRVGVVHLVIRLVFWERRLKRSSTFLHCSPNIFF